MKEAVHNYVKKEGVQEEHIPLDQSNYRAWSLTPGLLSQPTYSWHPHLHPPPCHHCSPCVRPWWNFWHLFLSISNERSLCNKTAPFSHKDVAVFPSVFSNTVAYISINAHSKLKKKKQRNSQRRQRGVAEMGDYPSCLPLSCYMWQVNSCLNHICFKLLWIRFFLQPDKSLTNIGGSGKRNGNILKANVMFHFL